MQLEQLLQGMATMQVKGERTVEVNDVVYDSRRVASGNLFVCIRGVKTDGAKFIRDAIKAGATAIVGEDAAPTDLPPKVTYVQVNDARVALSHLSNRFYQDPTRHMTLIGITGTNGKTTLSYLLESILSEHRKNCGVIGTVNYRYGGKQLKADRTTPESVDLFKLLQEMRQHGVSHAVMEVSSHALDLKRVNDCKFDIALLTNITQDHLDFHTTMANYVKAKAKLFALMEQGEKRGVAVINGDDPYSGAILETVRKRGKLKLLTFGLSQTCDYRIRDVAFTHDGFTAQLLTPESDKTNGVTIKANLPGRHNLANCLAAVAAARALQIDWNTIQRGIAALKNVPGRLECIATDRGVTAYIDYAHTEDALRNVLQALQTIRTEGQGGRGKIFTLFGCGGDRDRTKRPRMGDAAASLSDRVIVTSDNPRSEEPLRIIDEITAAPALKTLLQTPEAFLRRREERQPLATVMPDRREAIRLALEAADNGDLILIAGKGHEDYQEIKGVMHHFSDREATLQQMGKLGWNVVSA